MQLDRFGPRSLSDSGPFPIPVLPSLTPGMRPRFAPPPMNFPDLFAEDNACVRPFTPE